MSSHRFSWACLAVASWLFTASAARAEPPRADPPARFTASAPAPTWRTTGTWGWFLVGSGVAVGAIVTTYGLTFECGEADRGCQQRASIAIWSGFGIAAVASAVGLAVVQAGRVRVQVAPRADSALPTLTVGAAF